jgi:hypothetical protein
MRGSTAGQEAFLMSLTPDQLIPQDHPIRRIKAIVERSLAALSADFDAMYAQNGRPSIPPERLLKGSLLRAAALRHALQVVPGHEHGRGAVRPDQLHQEP